MRGRGARHSGVAAGPARCPAGDPDAGV